MRRLHPLQRAYFGFSSRPGAGSPAVPCRGARMGGGTRLLQADLADIAIEYRQQLDVGQAIIERAASPDMLLH